MERGVIAYLESLRERTVYVKMERGVNGKGVARSEKGKPIVFEIKKNVY